ncbi:P-loop containing nucleoside triphosphate hydrolase protein [Jimgerdemannia flammicorona]|uniref:GTP-binding protein 8 n=2 Tax=Jimgerdemannia flammicorona TaxID=994334 RepID=A0A433QCL9_9FUNG|nr:P-loop containing nucleoside triphosphate hydrolase protein [Jimgerdemannia flammicorona]RUS27548.1 P-loop containing nucleoside triphosphate hydrolase protein [Jimgerdemannia flammicorona]
MITCTPADLVAWSRAGGLYLLETMNSIIPARTRLFALLPSYTRSTHTLSTTHTRAYSRLRPASAPASPSVSPAPLISKDADPPAKSAVKPNLKEPSQDPPLEPTPAQLKLANSIFSKPAVFIKSAAKFEQVPKTKLPEVAFIGRSNVGKSTLINLLTDNKRLVKTAKNPGHTRLMNFFNIGDRLILVDMPGYGFRSRNEWGVMILDYFVRRDPLRCIFLLLNPLHGLKPRDRDAIDMLNAKELPYQIVLTKTDLMSAEKYDKIRRNFEKQIDKPIVGINQKGEGVERVRWAVVKACEVEDRE